MPPTVCAVKWAWTHALICAASVELPPGPPAPPKPPRPPKPPPAPPPAPGRAAARAASPAIGQAAAETGARAAEAATRAAEPAAAESAARHVVVNLVLGDELFELGEARRRVGAPETADRHDRDATGGQFHRGCAVRAVGGRGPCVAGRPALKQLGESAADGGVPAAEAAGPPGPAKPPAKRPGLSPAGPPAKSGKPPRPAARPRPRPRAPPGPPRAPVMGGPADGLVPA